jgi:hypothetical protein
MTEEDLPPIDDTGHVCRATGRDHDNRNPTREAWGRSTENGGPAPPDLWWKPYYVELEDLDFGGLFRSRGLWSSDRGGDRLVVRCPWAAGHRGADDTAHIHAAAPGRVRAATYYCRDEDCRGRGLWDVLRFFGRAAVAAHLRRRRPDKARRVRRDERAEATPA